MGSTITAVHPPVAFCRDGGAWAVFEVEASACAFASDEERSDQLARAAGALWSAGSELHLLGLTHPIEEREALARLQPPEADRPPDPQAPAWARRIVESGATERRIALALKLPDPDRSPWSALRKAASDVRRAVESAAGVLHPSLVQDPRTRAAQARQAEALLASRLQVRPGDLRFIAWVLRRPYERDIPPPSGPSELLPEAAEHLSAPGIAAVSEAVVEEHLRHLRVETDRGESLHAYLALAQLPARLPFPGAEWLFLAEQAPFPVDWSVRVRVVPAREARARAERKALELADQDHQLSGGDLPAPLALAEARSDAEELRYRLQTTGAPLLFCSVLFCVWGRDERELRSRVEELQSMYAPRGIQLARPTGDQHRAFQEAALGSRSGLRDYVQVLPPETLSGALPFAARGAGDRGGQLLGFTSGGVPRPVFVDPTLPPLRHRSPSMAIVGTLGAGKSFAAKLVVQGAVGRGARALVIDPKEEYTALAALFGDQARVVRLSKDARASLDPFAFVRDPEAARSAALSFLTLLLGVPPVSSQGAALARALAEIASSESPRLSALPGALDAHGDEGRALHDRLQVFLSLPLARLAFGETGEPTLAGGLTVVQTPDLELPDERSLDRDLREGRLAPERQLSLALLYLVASLGQSLVEGERRTLKLLVVDEAWTVVRTPEGQALIERLVRTGRSRNAGVILITQDASDLPQTVRDNLGIRLAFRAGGADSARAALSLLGAQESRDNLDLLRTMATGTCLIRDLDGRIELVDVARALPEHAGAFESSPGGPG